MQIPVCLVAHRRCSVENARGFLNKLQQKRIGSFIAAYYTI